MPRFDTPPCFFRLMVMMVAGFFSLAAAGGAVAKNGGHSNDHGSKSSEKHEIKSKSTSLKAIRKDTAGKDKPRHSDKKDKKKDKAPGKSADKPKDKDSVTVISGGFVRDKLPNGTVYYRRASKAELEKAAKDNSGSTTPGTPTAGNSSPPATQAPGSPPPATGSTVDNGPVVRDHRPGGNSAYPAPGTIIRDHRNGADGTPMVVVKAGPTGTVTRRATDADLKKAGLQKPDEPGLLDKVGHALNNLPGAAKAGPAEKTSTSSQQ